MGDTKEKSFTVTFTEKGFSLEKKNINQFEIIGILESIQRHEVMKFLRDNKLNKKGEKDAI